MGLSVNKVFEFVQFVANKEHRGWVSPEEFNLAAEVAQLTIYSEKESLFAQTKKIASDMMPFLKTDPAVAIISSIAPYPTGMRHFVSALNNVTYKRLDEYTSAEIGDILSSSILQPDADYPACVQFNDGLHIYPVTYISDLVINYLVKPDTPNWGYGITGGRPVYQATGGVNGDSVDFGFDEILFMPIATRILEHVGVNIKDAELVQLMNINEQKEIKQ